MLDLELTLDALMADCLNTSSLYTVKLKPSMAECIHVNPKVNGHTLDVKSSGVSAVTKASMLSPVQENGTQPKATKSTLSEETVRETFAHFGTVERVVLPSKPGKHARHAHISEFKAILFFFASCTVCVGAHEKFLCVSGGQSLRGRKTDV